MKITCLGAAATLTLYVGSAASQAIRLRTSLSSGETSLNPRGKVLFARQSECKPNEYACTNGPGCCPNGTNCVTDRGHYVCDGGCNGGPLCTGNLAGYCCPLGSVCTEPAVNGLNCVASGPTFPIPPAIPSFTPIPPPASVPPATSILPTTLVLSSPAVPSSASASTSSPSSSRMSVVTTAIATGTSAASNTRTALDSATAPSTSVVTSTQVVVSTSTAAPPPSTGGAAPVRPLNLWSNALGGLSAALFFLAI